MRAGEISEQEYELVRSLSAENNRLRKRLQCLRRDYSWALNYIKKLRSEVREQEQGK